MLVSRLLSWLLTHYEAAVIAMMCGFLVGSLTIIWPWKEVLQSVVSHSGKTIVLASQNLWPSQYSQVVGADPKTLVSFSAMAFGLLLVLVLEYVGARSQKKSLQVG